MIQKFDDIRPYIDAEIPAAMQRIADSEYFPEMAKFIFPDRELSNIKEMVRNFSKIYDFQIEIMYELNRQIINKTVDQFTYSGIKCLDPEKQYLFVSNHRDIVLDSSLLQTVLYLEGMQTTEITFGSNLMSSQLIIDIGRSNKMFKVMRGENPREFYKTSQYLSEYIRHTITQKGESVWIAQRNGRTKDGNDATDQGLVKMFCMSNTKDLIKSIEELNIVPVAVSYQWEPCDILKTKELYLSQGGAKYVKQANEDLISILTGFTQWKGNIHISICEPLEKEEYVDFIDETPNKFYKSIANLIDERIYSNYKLWNTNYIANDIRSGKNQYATHYTSHEKDEFQQRFQQTLSQISGDRDVISSIFLGIYANSIVEPSHK